jgi:glucokinase
MSTYGDVVRLLLREPMTLAGLQAAAQVSLPTLRKAVQELTDSHWIRIVGQAEANGGRPAMLYGLDESHFMLVGMHLQLPGIRLILTDLNSNILDERELFTGIVPGQSQSISTVADYISEIRAAYPERRIVGIGIASPGFIDPRSGDIITIGRVPAWSNFPYCHRLQVAVNLPVEIANDIDCMAFAEFEHSDRQRMQNLAYIGFDEGVKASLFLNGEFYRGALGNAGLISSHLLRVESILNHEDTGNLLSIPGTSMLFEKRVQALDPSAQTRYADILNATTHRTRFQLILANAHADMPVCQSILADLISVLSAAVADLIYIIQPNAVVIGGFLSSLPGALYDQLETAIRSQLPSLISNNLIIQQGTLTSQNSAAAGAVQYFLQNHLAGSGTDLLQMPPNSPASPR